MLKIEDLKVGGEVECVSSFHVEIKEKDRLEVTDVNERSLSFMSIKNGNKYTFNKSYMDCFKKIEKYTFDDLIDVAVQAVKDGLIACDDFKRHSISFCVAWDEDDGYELASHHDAKYFNEAIEFIKSLYKETFVIESINDAERLNNGAKTTLKNGEVIYFQNIDDGDFWFTFNGYGCDKFPFLALKGAKVEQTKV